METNQYNQRTTDGNVFVHTRVQNLTWRHFRINNARSNF